MSNLYYLGLYTLNGKTPEPCNDTVKWAAWFHNADRTVKKTKIDDVEVSTVFIGVDSNLTDGPFLFETMIFGGDRDGEMWRSKTWEESEELHDKIVKEVENDLGPSEPTDRFRLMDL